VNAASADDTGVLTVPSGFGSTFDEELRTDLSSAAWLIAAVCAPAVAALAFVVG
jgi:hypothetical protein